MVPGLVIHFRRPYSFHLLPSKVQSASLRWAWYIHQNSFITNWMNHVFACLRWFRLCYCSSLTIDRKQCILQHYYYCLWLCHRLHQVLLKRERILLPNIVSIISCSIHLQNSFRCWHKLKHDKPEFEDWYNKHIIWACLREYRRTNSTGRLDGQEIYHIIGKSYPYPPGLPLHYSSSPLLPSAALITHIIFTPKDSPWHGPTSSWGNTHILQ